jgi:hypothetical protein
MSQDSEPILQKIYVAGKDEVSVFCPACRKHKTYGLATISHFGRPCLLKCNCGRDFFVVFDERRYYRKTAFHRGYLIGTYFVETSDDPHLVRIVNLSKHGALLHTMDNNKLEIGSRVKLRFSLDNQNHTRIACIATIRGVVDRYVGVEFGVLDEHSQKELGFYLMPD